MNDGTGRSSLLLTRRPDGVALLTFDTPGSPVNVLSSALFDEFAAMLGEVERDREIVAVVLASGKADSFIAGADLKELLEIRLPVDGQQFSRAGHALLDRIAASRKPYVAAIHGAALGGGLEVALACHYRVASDDPKTVLGLPEVTLGLLPGGGGTQRLPRLAGLRRALPMLLTGRRVRALRSLRYNLVDAVVPAAGLAAAAAAAALALASGAMRPPARRPPLVDRLLTLPLVRSVALALARRELLARTRGNYPAPELTLRCVEVGLARGRRAGFEQESWGFGVLTAGPESKELIRLFLATTELKRERGDGAARPVERVGVVGAGLMGAGIAAASLERAPVTLVDVSLEALGRGVRAVDEGLAHRVASGSITRLDADRLRSRLRVTTRLGDVASSDLVVEAVFEQLELKRRVLAEIEASVAPESVIASNTSALPIREIAAAAARPERVVGMHYFSPVHRMQLLELVAPAAAAGWAVETARAFGAAQGKTVIVVRDGPGFYTTRILAPYIAEAAAIAGEGGAFLAVDEALERFGFPVGPLALADEVGLDVAAPVADSLAGAFAARGFEPAGGLGAMVAAGLHGRKTGAGFYRYGGRRPKGGREVNEAAYEFFGGRARRDVAAREVADRLALLMVNEAAFCLQEEVVASPRDGDLGAVLGLGFPPFRGGPFRYADALGAAAIVDALEAFARRLGPRFLPAPLLVDIARAGARFHAA